MPAAHGSKKLDKAAVMRKAVEYIQYLEAQNGTGSVFVLPLSVSVGGCACVVCVWTAAHGSKKQDKAAVMRKAVECIQHPEAQNGRGLVFV